MVDKQALRALFKAVQQIPFGDALAMTKCAESAQENEFFLFVGNMNLQSAQWGYIRNEERLYRKPEDICPDEIRNLQKLCEAIDQAVIALQTQADHWGYSDGAEQTVLVQFLRGYRDCISARWEAEYGNWKCHKDAGSVYDPPKCKQDPIETLLAVLQNIERKNL